jgi:pimeloyl-ACP methyl ester carboxylesterase
MKTWVRDGVRMCYAESTLAGANAAPIVFVHGWCCDHRYFAPQFGHFSTRHHVVAVDQRGFGASDKPQQKYTIEGFADDLAALCRELGLVKPALVGHSMGGAIVLAVAARHPNLPRAIALCDPAVIIPSYVLEATQGFIAALATPDYKNVAAAFVEQRLFGPKDDPVRRARIIADMCDTPQHVMLVLVRQRVRGARLQGAYAVDRRRGAASRSRALPRALPAARRRADGGRRSLPPARSSRAGELDAREISSEVSRLRPEARAAPSRGASGAAARSDAQRSEVNQTR